MKTEELKELQEWLQSRKGQTFEQYANDLIDLGDRILAAKTEDEKHRLRWQRDCLVSQYYWTNLTPEEFSEMLDSYENLGKS